MQNRMARVLASLSFFFAFVILNSSFILASDWPQFGRDAARSGFSPDPLPEKAMRLAWTHDFFPQKIAKKTQVIAAGGLVYIGTRHGNLYALDAKTGEMRWDAETGGYILHSLAYAGGRVFAAVSSIGIVAFDAATGKHLWTLPAQCAFVTAPLVDAGLAIACAHDGAVYAADQNTGALAWEYEAGAPLRQSPCSDGARVFFGAEDMRMRAIELKTGRESWTSELMPGTSFRGYHPVCHNGMVFTRILGGGSAYHEAWRIKDLQSSCWQSSIFDSHTTFKLRADSAVAHMMGLATDAERLELEQNEFLAQAKADTSRKSLAVFDAATGNDALVTTATTSPSNPGIEAPVAVGPDGAVYLLYQSPAEAACFLKAAEEHGGFKGYMKPMVDMGALDLATGKISRSMRVYHTTDEDVAITLTPSHAIVAHAVCPWRVPWNVIEEAKGEFYNGGNVNCNISKAEILVNLMVSSDRCHTHGDCQAGHNAPSAADGMIFWNKYSTVWAFE